MSNKARFVMIERKTRLTELVERFNTWSQARFYLEHAGMDANDYLEEHDQYKAVLFQIESMVKPLGRLARLERTNLDTYQFHSEDIVLVIGQDGLVANTLKYLDGQSVVAINPDPSRWGGQLLPFQVDNSEQAIKALLAGKVSIADIRLAEAKTNDGQTMLAVNDLFIGPKTHASARYELAWGNKTEIQSSSGIIVSTGLGRTGWLTSILTGAKNLTGARDQLSSFVNMEWDSDYLYFAVREPFPSQTTQTDLTIGRVDNKHPLSVTSYMPTNGVIFSDGMESDAIEFNAGTRLSIDLAKKVGKLVML
jgi:NAD kinase